MCHANALEEISERLLKLEKQNRTLKRIGAAALVVAASILLMGQAASKKTVEANEFIVKDAGGHVRARLAMNQKGDAAEIALLDASGARRVTLDGGSVPGLTVYDAGGMERGSFVELPQGGAFIQLWDDETPYQAQAMLDTAGLSLLGRRGNAMLKDDGLSFHVGNTRAVLGPGRLSISDDAGFEASLGKSKLVTPLSGEKHETSAASLILFDKDNKVIWKAP